MQNGSADFEGIELANERAILDIPENCVELTLNCKVFLDGELKTVMRTMSLKEIREAFDEYKVAEECGYIPPNALFALTEEGKEYVEDLMRKRNGS